MVMVKKCKEKSLSFHHPRYHGFFVFDLLLILNFESDFDLLKRKSTRPFTISSFMFLVFDLLLIWNIESDLWYGIQRGERGRNMKVPNFNICI